MPTVTVEEKTTSNAFSANATPKITRLPIPMAVPRQMMVTMFTKMVKESRALLSIQRIVATIDASSNVGTLAIVPIYLAVGMNNANAISANASPKRMRQHTHYNMAVIFLQTEEHIAFQEDYTTYVI